MKNKIKIGWSEVSIVPEGRRVDLAGQFYERISGDVETPIVVTALAMECGDDHMVFCFCLHFCFLRACFGICSSAFSWV